MLQFKYARSVGCGFSPRYGPIWCCLIYDYETIENVRAGRAVDCFCSQAAVIATSTQSQWLPRSVRTRRAPTRHCDRRRKLQQCHVVRHTR